MKMLWPGNSPDLNAIEKAWFWIKKETTKREPTSNRKKLRVRWEKCWEDLPQSKIQEQITVIPDYVKEIIRLEGGNEYKEGRKKGQEKVAIYQIVIQIDKIELIKKQSKLEVQRGKPHFRGPLQGLQGTRTSYREIKVRPYRAFSGLHKIMPCIPDTLCRCLRIH